MTSFTSYIGIGVLSVSLAFDWVTGQVVQHEVASSLSRKGAIVSFDVPSVLKGRLYDSHESRFFHRHWRDLAIALVDRVTAVQICDTELEDEDLKLLQYLPYLEYVEIDDSDINGSGVEYLQHCHSLEYLDVDATNFSAHIGASQLKGLKSLPQLRTLILVVPQYDYLAGLGELAQLRELTIRGLAIKPSDLAELKRLRHLDNLAFEDSCRKDALTKLDFSGWPALTRLRLSKVQLSSEEWNSVFSNEGLIRLFIEDMVLFPPQFKECGRLRNLRALHFRDIRFDSGWTFDLSKLSRLEYLTFLDSSGIDSSFDDLAKLPNLRRLILDGSAVPDKVIEELILGSQFECLILDQSISATREAVFLSNNRNAKVLRSGGYFYDDL